jgi:hypothetical protein
MMYRKKENIESNIFEDTVLGRIFGRKREEATGR